MPRSMSLRTVMRDLKEAFASKKDLQIQMNKAKTPKEKTGVLLKRMQRPPAKRR